MAAILVVDDEMGIAHAVGSILRMHGYKTLMAYSGGEALQQVADQSVGLALVDMMMPEMNGLQFLHILRQKKSGLQVPVVIMSALPPPSRAIQQDSNYQAYLHKPFQLCDLLQICRTYLMPASPAG